MPHWEKSVISHKLATSIFVMIALLLLKIAEASKEEMLVSLDENALMEARLSADAMIGTAKGRTSDFNADPTIVRTSVQKSGPLDDLAATANDVASTIQQPGSIFADPLSSGGKGPWMVVIPKGSFHMGCVSGEDCLQSAFPVHDVTISQPFAVSKYEVTFEDFDRFTLAMLAQDECMDDGPRWRSMAHDEGWGRGRRPVINVSWCKARKYAEWLSHATGHYYRLLTEAEWEYAARAGSSSTYSWGNSIGCNQANCSGDLCADGFEYTAPVGSFESNAFGLHDMHGNVQEWVEDCWNGSYLGGPIDGSAWNTGDCDMRVLRGGSWYSNPWNLGSSFRDSNSAKDGNYNIGFRVARLLLTQ